MKQTNTYSYYLAAVGALAVYGWLTAVGVQGGDTQALRQWKRDIAQAELMCEGTTCETGSIVLPFSSTTVSVQAETLDGLRVRFQEETTWSDWKTVEGESDVPDGESDARPYALMGVHDARAIRIQTTSRSNRITITALAVPNSAKNGFVRVRMAAEESVQAPTIAAIIPREGWLDAGLELEQTKEDSLWAREYVQDKKFIIHHTATVIRDANGDGALTGDDYREAVRAIYSYHTYSRGWGDIGYNYIIDPDGTIWEGRAGGDGVVAGHTRRSAQCTKFGTPNIGFNDGSIGIALLGAYDTRGISIPAYDALVRLIAQKSWELNIDPAGSGFFKDTTYPNILGHRDIDCTNCPGTTVADGLPDIIRATNIQYDALAEAYPRRIAGQLVDITPPFIEMRPGQERNVIVRFRNTGTVAWRNYGQEKLSLAYSDITRHIAAIDSVHMAVVDDNGKDAGSVGASARPKDYIVAGLAAPNVSPGQIGTFIFRITQAPAAYQSTQKFVLAVGEDGWLAGSEASIPITNTGLEYAAQSADALHATISDTEQSSARIQFMNKGTKTWARGDVVLSIVGVDGNEYGLAGAKWKSKEGDFIFDEKTVGPGKIATFTVPLFGKAVGDVVGMVALYHGSEKISGSDTRPLTISVTPSFVVQVTKSTAPRIVKNIWRPTVSITIKNTGTKELKGAKLLAFGTDGVGASPFYHPRWQSKTTIDTIDLKPGQTGTVIFKIKPPQKGGEYEFVVGLRAGKKDVYIEGADGLTKAVKQRILVDEPQKKTTASSKKKK